MICQPPRVLAVAFTYIPGETVVPVVRVVSSGRSRHCGIRPLQTKEETEGAEFMIQSETSMPIDSSNGGSREISGSGLQQH